MYRKGMEGLFMPSGMQREPEGMNTDVGRERVRLEPVIREWLDDEVLHSGTAVQHLHFQEV